MSEQLSIEQYRRELSQRQSPEPVKGKTPRTKSKRKAQPDTISAQQFRDEHVDQDEHDLQSLGIKWFYLAYPNLLLFAIPNAAKRSIILAARMADEGLTSGIPDLFLAYPVNGKPGLFIETKTINGKLSDAQIIVHAYLRAVGYTVAVPFTFEQIQYEINHYLH